MIKKEFEKGFSIIELVVVIAVIAILSSILIPTFAGVAQDAKESAALANAKSAYTQYFYDYTQAETNGIAIKSAGEEVKLTDNVVIVVNGSYYITVENGSVWTVEEGDGASVKGTLLWSSATDDFAETNGDADTVTITPIDNEWSAIAIYLRVDSGNGN